MLDDGLVDRFDVVGARRAPHRTPDVLTSLTRVPFLLPSRRDHEMTDADVVPGEPHRPVTQRGPRHLLPTARQARRRDLPPRTTGSRSPADESGDSGRGVGRDAGGHRGRGRRPPQAPLCHPHRYRPCRVVDTSHPGEAGIARRPTVRGVKRGAKRCSAMLPGCRGAAGGVAIVAGRCPGRRRRGPS